MTIRSIVVEIDTDKLPVASGDLDLTANQLGYVLVCYFAWDKVDACPPRRLQYLEEGGIKVVGSTVMDQQ